MNYSYGRGIEPVCNSLGMAQGGANLMVVSLKGMLVVVVITLMLNVVF